MSQQANRDTIATSLTRATTKLHTSAESPRLEAELLLAHILKCSRADLYTYPEQPLDAQQFSYYQHLLNQRALGVPLPYLTGHIEFYGLDLIVNQNVLIPRPETETLVDLALTVITDLTHHSPDRISDRDIAQRFTLADVGTGSGCIAVSLAVNTEDTHIYAVDVSHDALAVAQTNAQRFAVSDRITFLHSDLLESLPEPVDMVVANLPYITENEWAVLSSSVREYEPHLALYGGPDGFDLVRRLFSQIPQYLRSGGVVLVEIGATQGHDATKLAHRMFPSAHITLHTDLAGHDRALCVRTPHSTAAPPMLGAHDGYY